MKCHNSPKVKVRHIMLGTGKLCALYKRPVPWSPSMTQSCLTSDQSNFWAFLSKMSEFRPKSVKGNLVPLHSKFEVRNMVPRNCVKTKFWTFVQKWITLGMNYGWRPLKCCSVQNWTSFKTGEQFLPNWPKFSWLRKVYQTCIVSKFHVAPGKFQYRHMPEYCRNLSLHPRPKIQSICPIRFWIWSETRSRIPNVKKFQS